ncbi:DUF2237 domain-containing protein [Nocardioidaceae bacterium]|nr:DUF2237 domain-containing protein [Nocardioidaceae bacterium]
MVDERNVLGERLAACPLEPLAGSADARSCGHPGPGNGAARPMVCAVMTQEFLRHQRSVGNELSTPQTPSRFPGLAPGDSWCVPATRWRQAYEAGVAPPVLLGATPRLALEQVGLEALLAYAVDVPPDPGTLLG